MTTALAIIGGIVVILGATTRIPPAAAAFLRSCIPLVAAFRDLHDAVRDRARPRPNRAPKFPPGP